ncbi:cysteine desulfurase/selenocysteine lyase family PLP dependent transferase superfamily protein [Besnoitia besnoiti]|uniref:Cysteine desulfurase/selenocysteine lyase family PLP dependent transferase superfamily protein n=1 Tax=Besnoitia besnoiti TaxID=94643 RepID=A0A2A9MN89_BESBE|nr:cysteine desulfurase/selenocysteine lyase family PLP dependent transferase superfamily protein [Besnoitia besnoiti]PFH37656.1 cysteine desulfurase/selenocysteine lyase family PLP dependent transferase superfamily protein [Besnoitia besnoiti]
MMAGSKRFQLHARPRPAVVSGARLLGLLLLLASLLASHVGAEAVADAPFAERSEAEGCACTSTEADTTASPPSSKKPFSPASETPDVALLRSLSADGGQTDDDVPLVVPTDNEALAEAAAARRHTEGCSETEERRGASRVGMDGKEALTNSAQDDAPRDASQRQCTRPRPGAASERGPSDRYQTAFTAAQLFTASSEPAGEGDALEKTSRREAAAPTTARGEAVEEEAAADAHKRGLSCPLWGGSYEERRTRFLLRYGDAYNVQVEQIRQKELTRFEGQIYMDYAGSGVYQQQQLQQVFEDFSRSAYGNAHSRNPSAKRTDEKLKEARKVILRFFDAPEEDYAVIFTSGATAALKLVGESFPFATGVSSFYYLRINHNSVLGIREYAYAKEAKSVRALSPRDVERILKEREKEAKETSATGPDAEDYSMPSCLFAFPAKDNWNGRFFPLSWIERVKKVGLSDNCRWYVLVDAAAYAPTSPLSLAQYPADFVALSFYKIFGYPTGLGVLLARSEDADKLQRLYWGGGSVSASVCDSRWCARKTSFSPRFEDGTLPFLAIIASVYGFRALEAVGMEKIHHHVAALTKHLYERLQLLRHSNGAPAVLLYWNEPAPPEGGIVSFNLLRPDGSFVPFPQVEADAAEALIHLRTGCFCNPGGCQDFLGLSAEDIIRNSQKRDSCSDPTGATLSVAAGVPGLLTGLGGGSLEGGVYRKPAGSVRLSMGYMSTFADVDAIIAFLSDTYLW